MRAYTSLLGHILGSHPQIDGYYEMHRSYASGADLERQVRDYAAQEHPKPGSRYLFDKLLHNDFTLDLALPGLGDAVTLVALRQPEPTLKSIVSLFAKKDIDDLYADPAGATTYYVERLHALAAFGRQQPQRYFYFDAERVHNDTRRLLDDLGRWLQLASPLTERYQLFSQTGTAGKGDSSPAIASGHIIRQQSRYPDITLDPALLQQATQAYRHCRQQLLAGAINA
ncbi:MAG: hypothetical protein GC183_11925 [Thiobacillus sp.]|nr:hypothetical protein [Thiobacillus sp.]